MKGLLLCSSLVFLLGVECCLLSQENCEESSSCETHKKRTRCCRHRERSTSYEDSYIHPVEETTVKYEASYPSRDEDAFYEYFTR